MPASERLFKDDGEWIALCLTDVRTQTDPASPGRPGGMVVGHRYGPVALVLGSMTSLQFGAAIAKGLFDEVGATKFPETWTEYREVGKKLKAKGRPIGQTLGHTFGDSPTFTYPFLWSHGGKEVEADGKTVATVSTSWKHDPTVRTFDAVSGREMAAFSSPSDRVYSHGLAGSRPGA